MPKILLTILAILIFPLLLTKAAFADSLSISIFPLPPLTEQSSLSITYTGMENNNDCLVIYFRKDNDYLKLTGGRTNQQCFTDSNAYNSFQVLSTSGSLGIEAQPPGNYDLFIRDYKESCNIDAFGQKAFCKWELRKTSNTLKFTVVPLESNYSATTVVKPSSGKSTDKFIVETSVTMKEDGAPLAKAGITLDTPNSSEKPIGEGLTDDSGKSIIDISDRTTSLPNGQYNIRAKIFTPTGTITTNSTLTITNTGSSTGAALKCTGDSCTKAGGEPCANNPDGIQTAIGCINTKPEALIEDVFKLAVGVGGGMAFLLMVFGAFGMVTSAGNPEALKESQQRFVNAIIGILFIVFSTLLLQIIGVDILQIPGFVK